MKKRGIKFGTYDTAEQGWTLTGWELSMPEYKSNFVEVPGRDGDLDMSTALTDGVPRYGNRNLTVALECSDGNRLTRQAMVNTMVNWLDGWRMDVWLPDDADHYLAGRVSIRPEYNDMAHSAVSVSVVCDPWRYRNHETVVNLTASESSQIGRLTNNGRRSVVPVLTITGDAASVALGFAGSSWVLGAGVYQLPDLVVSQGGADITYSGTGALSFAYREAVL